jgi:hypothetical protein
MTLTGLTPRPRPVAAPANADPPLALTVTHHTAPTPTDHTAPTAHIAPTATPDRANGHPPPHTVVIMTSGAYAST